MTLKTEKHHNIDGLLSEAAGYRSRDEIKIASGSGVVPAMRVLGKVTASGKFVPHTLAAVDGSQTAAAVNLYEIDATSADVRASAVTRDAEVRATALGLDPAADTDAEKAAIYTALAANHVIVR